MALSVVTNISMLKGIHSLGRAQGIISQAAERLATGKRINRASDDPAGMIAVTNIAAERSSLGGKISSAEREVHMLGATEGALSVIEDLFHELEGLTHEAANRDGFSEEEREAYQLQAEAIYKTIDNLVQTSTFNGKRILADSRLVSNGNSAQLVNGINVGNLGGVSRETENDLGETVTESFSLKDIFGDLSLVDGDIELAAESVSGARKFITRRRAEVGIRIQQTESDIRISGDRMDKLAEIESEIRDADYAEEVANLVRGQLLEQAAISMMKFAQQIPKAALSLLPGSGNFSRLF